MCYNLSIYLILYSQQCAEITNMCLSTTRHNHFPTDSFSNSLQVPAAEHKQGCGTQNWRCVFEYNISNSVLHLCFVTQYTDTQISWDWILTFFQHDFMWHSTKVALCYKSVLSEVLLVYSVDCQYDDSFLFSFLQTTGTTHCV